MSNAVKSKDKTTTRLEYIVENREGYDLIIFAHVMNKFFKKNPELVFPDDLTDFVLLLVREKRMGKYFHNTYGPAYGALYRHNNGIDELKHDEYWVKGKRIVNIPNEEELIDKIIKRGQDNV